MRGDIDGIEAAVFDVFGTLTDWRTSVTAELAAAGERAELTADWPSVADDWRRAYPVYLRRVVDGELPYRPLDALHRLMLDEVLAERGLEALSGAERDGLVRAWHRLRPWPDVPPGLERLRASTVLTATLSNGGVGLLTRLTKRAGLRLDAILSAELAGSYKPDARVYRKAAELLQVPPHRLLMVACHPDDLTAAARSGLRTAYLPRAREWGPDAAAPPPPEGVDLVVDDLPSLADALTR
ncbi:haloacid dehalogenase type II [Streptomyces boncukensis]|uniref:Haloacid dehalogenase type II n=1 Tax=Streptomyces boncukensis TaxID=2711219 RepID=A0A6G4X496_9ACTN|nr:haloacid dehalogenase type II [Streptomyces boncukensis]NGO71700.1 haloacid dehalogenase type II [Streptomyces boncukensis]